MPDEPTPDVATATPDVVTVTPATVTATPATVTVKNVPIGTFKIRSCTQGNPSLDNTKRDLSKHYMVTLIDMETGKLLDPTSIKRSTIGIHANIIRQKLSGILPDPEQLENCQVMMKLAEHKAGAEYDRRNSEGKVTGEKGISVNGGYHLEDIAELLIIPNKDLRDAMQAIRTASRQAINLGDDDTDDRP